MAVACPGHFELLKSDCAEGATIHYRFLAAEISLKTGRSSKYLANSPEGFETETALPKALAQTANLDKTSILRCREPDTSLQLSLAPALRTSRRGCLASGRPIWCFGSSRAPEFASYRWLTPKLNADSLASGRLYNPGMGSPSGRCSQGWISWLTIGGGGLVHRPTTPGTGCDALQPCRGASQWRGDRRPPGPPDRAEAENPPGALRLGLKIDQRRPDPSRRSAGVECRRGFGARLAIMATAVAGVAYSLRFVLRHGRHALGNAYHFTGQCIQCGKQKPTLRTGLRWLPCVLQHRDGAGRRSQIPPACRRGTLVQDRRLANDRRYPTTRILQVYLDVINFRNNNYASTVMSGPILGTVVAWPHMQPSRAALVGRPILDVAHLRLFAAGLSSPCFDLKIDAPSGWRARTTPVSLIFEANGVGHFSCDSSGRIEPSMFLDRSAMECGSDILARSDAQSSSLIRLYIS